jgi:osmoprotectant transport system ATP-binding protein
MRGNSPPKRWLSESKFCVDDILTALSRAPQSTRLILSMTDDQDRSSIVEFRRVGFRLDGGRKLLSDLNITVKRGETLVLLGRSGSGKTTTLKLINRLLEPTDGSVLVEGRATTDWEPIQLRRHIGYAIQDVGLFPHFTVERNIGLVPSI